MFFRYKCVKIADGSVMCGCWAACKPVWSNMGRVYAWGGGWFFYKCSLIGKYVGYFISSNALVCAYFVNVNFVWGPVYMVYDSYY